MSAGTRLEGRTALVVGGGQTPGEGVGNGRATALTFAREGAFVAVADRRLESAQDTVELIEQEGGRAIALPVDVTEEASVIELVARANETLGRIDVLHNNVGVSIAGGDAPLEEIEPEAFDRVIRINLLGMVLACKHVVPLMRAQGGGAIVNIGSSASRLDYPLVAYKTSKAGVIALTEQLAIRQAPYGIRANVIMPGLMATPMAIESRVGRDGMTREQVVAERNGRIPLGGRMGTGWDVANAALFLASDEAAFITGVTLPVDGGQVLAVG